MIRVAAFGALALAVCSASADDKKDVPKELAPFQGTWKIVKLEKDGKPAGPEKVDEIRFKFAGDKMSVSDPDTGKDNTGKIAVDATKEPAEFDFISSKGDKTPSIYRVEKDGKLTFSLAKSKDAPRPKKFDEKDVLVLVLEKVKE